MVKKAINERYFGVYLQDYLHILDMEEFQTFLETIKRMPMRSTRLCSALVVPSSFPQSKVTDIEKLIDRLGIERISFSSRPDLEKMLLETNSLENKPANSPLICLITGDQFRAVNLSGLADLVFQFPES